MTIEKNAGKWQRNWFLQNGAFLGAQGPSMQAKFIFRKKIKIEHPGQAYLHTKWRGDEKSWLMHTAPPFCKGKNSLEPSHSVGFSQYPAFYSYKMVALTPWGEF